MFKEVENILVFDVFMRYAFLLVRLPYSMKLLGKRHFLIN